MLFHFFSHLAGPSVVDWNEDGRLDVLMGGDLRRMLGVTVSMPRPVRSHYFVYDGRSLSEPSYGSEPEKAGRIANPPTGKKDGLAIRPTEDQHPNVLFIAVDDLNDWLGVMPPHQV
jgi:hypothetical protein